METTINRTDIKSTRIRITQNIKTKMRNRCLRPILWVISFFVWTQPASSQTTTWKGAFDNIKGMGESGSEVLNMFAVLIGSGMAIFGWVGLTSETKKQQRGVMGSIILIVVGALLIVWRVVVKTNVGQIFGEGTDVPFLDS